MTGDNIPEYHGGDAKEVTMGKAKRKNLTPHEIRESIRFADGALAAAGHQVKRRDARVDARRALRGEISFDEAIDRAAARAKR